MTRSNLKCVLVALGAAALAVTLPAQQAAPQKLTPVPLEAYPRLIAAHKGHVVLVNFWATYCIPCRAEIPEMVKLADRLRARGLDFVSISADEPEQEPQARKFIVAAKVPGTLYIKSAEDDDKYAAGIHPRWGGELPASFIYDRTGKKVGAFMGEVPLKNIEDVIAKFL
ncbi:MAG TPA: TlpA disulfide reductase family protein [Bryobacteraceae bacterium]